MCDDTKDVLEMIQDQGKQLHEVVKKNKDLTHNLKDQAKKIDCMLNDVSELRDEVEEMTRANKDYAKKFNGVLSLLHDIKHCTEANPYAHLPEVATAQVSVAAAACDVAHLDDVNV